MAQRETTVYPTALTQNGWYLDEICPCRGIKKYKFKHVNYPGVVISWWINYYSFSATRDGVTIQPQAKLATLDAFLADLTYQQRFVSKARVQTQTAAKPLESGVPKNEDTLSSTNNTSKKSKRKKDETIQDVATDETTDSPATEPKE